jgi:hypothetical protein
MLYLRPEPQWLGTCGDRDSGLSVRRKEPIGPWRSSVTRG